ncbi:STAS domain-containing protein [Streptomyces sp. NPDC059861]|uniref:STAS domain-containing protein n=1 Tax=Streptomyces sp. NPDC059861 TaxID=3346974 RepID=UPI00365AEEC7
MDPLTVSYRRRQGWTVVEVTGELDIATADALRGYLDGIVAAYAPVGVVLDLSRLQFCDASGLRVLVGAHRAVLRRHGRLRLVCPDGMISLVLRITALATLIPVHATLAEALTPGPDEDPPVTRTDGHGPAGVVEAGRAG